MKILKELLDNKFNMIMDNQGGLVLNYQKKLPSPHNEPQRSPGFAQKQPPELFCKKGIQNFANFTEKHVLESPSGL